MYKIPILLLILSIGFSACGTRKVIIRPDDLQNTTTIIMVRHAEKANDGTSDPSLTPQGKVRAQRLAAMLSPMQIDAVYSTPYQRTRLTGTPTAELKNLAVREYPPHDAGFLPKLLDDHRGETVLVVGHSNTIPELVNSLTDENFGQLEESEYDKLFVVEVVNGIGRVLVFSY